MVPHPHPWPSDTTAEQLASSPLVLKVRVTRKVIERARTAVPRTRHDSSRNLGFQGHSGQY